MNVSVILCTYNRCQSLIKTLESLSASVIPPSTEWEVVIVDNNSTDETRSVVERFCQKYPTHFRYFFERRQGKSFALNSGILETRGEIIAFVDDDVTVEPTWLESLMAPFHDSRWGGSGGRIRPERGFVAPPWLPLQGSRNLGVALCAEFDLGDRLCELKDAPFGTNMAFRRSMFVKYGDFRTDLGPRPGSEMRNEDTEFGRRLIAGGEHLCYVPTAIVYHEVHKERLRRGFFLAWWFDRGRAAIRESETAPGIREILTAIPAGFRAAAGSILSLDPQVRFHRRCMAWYAAGRLTEAYKRAVEQKHLQKRAAKVEES
jgi:glycosyltransferase involved in cell wall biosynthesis